MRIRLIALQLVVYSVFFMAGVNAAPTFESVGSEDEVKYARSLWKELSRLRIVGEQARPLVVIYGGARPHGTYLQLASQNITLNGHQGFLVLKKNHSGEGITEQQVVDHPTRYLQSITVMYQREQGYDVDNQNWFWVKFKPDGRLFTKEMAGQSVGMAGRIFKGKSAEDNRGCIYCHASAGGGDYIFYPQIQKPTL